MLGSLTVLPALLSRLGDKVDGGRVPLVGRLRRDDGEGRIWILFGLSMDYHVFILSRIRETFDRGASIDDAISHGIKSSASVVTSAAIVMVAVFSIFATLSMLFFKQFGIGLATAILLDATIVRAVLLPATMKLLGNWNWYLPRWLEWLPGGGVESEQAPNAPHVPAPA